MSQYRCVYTAYATNLSAAGLGALLAAVPRDTLTEALIGVTMETDVTAHSGNVVTRTIEYTDAGAPADAIMPKGAPMAEILQGFYTAVFARPIGTAIVAAPVVIH